MEAILVWVKSGLLFGILASVILMLSPNKAYEKHISMVVGLLFILVMLHPIMELFHLDRDTYTSYIKNFLMIETGENGISSENLGYYEETVAYQLEAALRESGYALKKVSVKANEEGEVEQVMLSFTEEILNAEKIELYLMNLFGEGVKISYEME